MNNKTITLNKNTFIKKIKSKMRMKAKNSFHMHFTFNLCFYSEDKSGSLIVHCMANGFSVYRLFFLEEKKNRASLYKNAHSAFNGFRKRTNYRILNPFFSLNAALDKSHQFKLFKCSDLISLACLRILSYKLSKSVMSQQSRSL